MDLNINKFKNINYVNNIFRKKINKSVRIDKLRFDRQERISPLPKEFCNKIVKNFKSEYVTCYPDLNNIYKKVAKFLKVKVENILLTSGSDIAIKNCYELLIRKKDEVVTIYPTYGMTNVYANLFQAKEKKIFFENKLFLDSNKIISAINKKTKLVIFANPNSPTGTIISEKKIFEILRKAKRYNTIVLIDECYYGFYEKTFIKCIKNFNNLIISRSFSKALGMAGSRIGVLISNKSLIEKLAKFRPMHEISHFSAYVLDLLLKNQKVFKTYLLDTNKGKKYFENFLKKNKLSFYKSYANFILVDFKSKKLMHKILKEAAKKNILIHGEPFIPGCENYIKFTTGPKEYMKIIEKLLKKFI